MSNEQPEPREVFPGFIVVNTDVDEIVAVFTDEETPEEITTDAYGALAPFEKLFAIEIRKGKEIISVARQ